jgi:hypothetical protein
MRRNVLTTELVLPIAVSVAIYLPIFIVGKLLRWPGGLLGIIEIAVVAFVVLSQERVCTWLAPRLGMPPPRRMGKRRDI